MGETLRQEMVREIAEEARITATYTGREAFAPQVMDAMARVPRHAFVPAAEESFAYVNGPLPIGHGQTISQPFIVALMTDLIDPEPGDVVLDIGTGSGYQAAVLAGLVKEVWSVEVIAELADSAAERLARLGYGNVHVRRGDGNAGWPEHAPYDAILVAAAGPRVPPALVEQLKPGGRMVIPLGGWLGDQQLTIIDKDMDGKVTQRRILPVAFVPLVEELYRHPRR
jgi:protein-L-isoaspartate(D-aspartate) O-methyltransferase